MINYADESLFYEDSIDKQLNIVGSNVNITNINLRQEEFELEEILNSTEELTFGECNSAKVTFSVGYYENSIVGKELTIKTTPYGGSEFQFGKYTVVSDEPNDKRSYRKIVAYDKLYDIIKADVTSWYNTVLPDSETTLTLKQFRDSFFTNLGVTQETQTLPNDNMTVQRTLDATVITGKTIINKICEVNGAFGKITRNGTFKYVFLEEPSSGLFPANTLYPSDSLYPQIHGFANSYNHIYTNLRYEDYIAKAINKLEIANSRGEVQVTIGSGNNSYIITDNFLLFNKSDNELTTIANNIYSKISNRWYCPVEIETIGNPCIETGDGLQLFTTEGKQLDTYVLRRTLSGIQSLKDVYESEGLEERANDRNGIADQIVQVKDNIRRVEADYVKTTTLEADYITASQISANYVATNYLTANYLTASEISATYVTTSSLTANYITASQISANYASVSALSAVDAKFQTLNASNIITGTLSASRIGAGSITGDKISADAFAGNTFTGSDFNVGTIHSTNMFIWAGGTKYVICPINEATYGFKIGT